MRASLIPLLMAAAAALLTPTTARAEASTFGIYVGSNVYQGADKLPLRYGDDDALRAASSLEADLPTHHVVLLIDPDPDTAQAAMNLGLPIAGPPTAAAVEMALQQVAAQIADLKAADPGAVARVLFFYSGHGDREGLHLADRRLGFSELKVWLEEVGTQADAVTVLADACYSGDAIFKGDQPPPGEVPAALDVELGGLDGVGWLATETATVEDHDLIRGGVVTHVALSALAGAADADLDRRVTWDELSAYVDFYRQRSDRFDRLKVVVRPPRRGGAQTRVIVDLRDRPQRGWSLAPEDQRGEECWWIQEAEGGRLVQEMCRRLSEYRRVYLPTGRYHVMRFDPRETYGVEGEVDVGQGFVELRADGLPGRWAREDKGASGGEEVRILSAEEAQHLDETPFREAVPWERYDLDLWSTAVGLGVSAPTEQVPRSLTADGPSVVLSASADRRWISLPLGYVSAGGEVDLAVTPGTALEGLEEVPVVALYGLGRVNWVYSWRSLSLRVVLSGGDAVGQGFDAGTIVPNGGQWLVPVARGGITLASRTGGAMALEVGAAYQRLWELQAWPDPESADDGDLGYVYGFDPYASGVFWGGVRW